MAHTIDALFISYILEIILRKESNVYFFRRSKKVLNLGEKIKISVQLMSYLWICHIQCSLFNLCLQSAKKGKTIRTKQTKPRDSHIQNSNWRRHQGGKMGLKLNSCWIFLKKNKYPEFLRVKNGGTIRTKWHYATVFSDPEYELMVNCYIKIFSSHRFQVN